MKKKACFVSLLGGLLLASCSSNGTSGTITLTDFVGREVSVVPGSYQKIVCVGAGALRLYSYLGDVSLLAGVEGIDNATSSPRPAIFDGVARPYYMANKSVFDTLPNIGAGGPQAQIFNKEAILAVEPDLIISELNDATAATSFQAELGNRVPIVEVGIGPKGVYDTKFEESLTLLGKLLNKESKATSLINFVHDQKNQITARTKDISEKPKVYICGLGNWGTTNHLSTWENYEPFNVASIDNVVSGTSVTGKAQTIEKDAFVSYGEQADVMIMDSAAVKNIKPLTGTDKDIIVGTKAWQSGKVYLQMAYNAYYTNLELALANTWFNAKCVYPEAFSDVDMAAKTNEITNAFLGKSLYEEIKGYQHSYGGYQQIDTSTFFGA